MGTEFDEFGPYGVGSIRVLHVEDDPDMGALTATGLERESPAIEVVSETDPTRVLERIADESVDCVVSDFDMPGWSGIELLESVREAYPDLPFVLFTGKGSEEVASEAISAGVDDYLQKRVGTEQFELLATRIENLVSERRAREGLARREEQFRSLFENIPDPGVIVEYVDDEPVIQSINDAFERTFGYSIDRVREKSLNELIVPPEEAASAEAIDQAARAGKQIEREVRRRTADGEVKDFLFRNATITPVAGDNLAHFGVYTDVTGMRERERELELYESVVNGAPDAIYALNTDWEFIMINDVLKAVLGRSKGDVLGKHVSLFDELGVISPGTIEEWTADVDRIFAGETDQLRFEVTATVDGSEIMTENHVSAVRDESGTYGVVNIIRDVTERHRREEQLRRQNARLEEFASVVSHDLRNPLNIATGNLELARETGDLEPLTEAERALNRMDEFIENLLTLARQGQTVEEVSSVDLAAAVRQAWRSVDGTATLEIPVTSVFIEADPDRLQQVLVNLLDNAVQHGGENPTITVGLLSDEQGFFVEDDGPGIPVGARDQVFDHGFTTADDGTGFGLSIVRGIVEAHGWSIGIGDSSTTGARTEITGVEFVDSP